MAETILEVKEGEAVAAPTGAPMKVEATVTVNTIAPYLIAVVLVFAIGAAAAAYSPSTGGMILAAAVPILVALMGILQKQASQDKVLAHQDKVQEDIHHAVNSQSEKLLQETRELYRMIGAKEGREAQKIDNAKAGTAGNE